MSKHREIMYDADAEALAALREMLTERTHKPKHRAHRFPYSPLGESDSRAKCLGGGTHLVTYGPSTCSLTLCPRHQPVNYADHMARHATDSIMPRDFVRLMLLSLDIGEDEDA